MKFKVSFQKINDDRLVIFYGKKIVNIISQNELIEYLNNEKLDIKTFEFETDL